MARAGLGCYHFAWLYAVSPSAIAFASVLCGLALTIPEGTAIRSEALRCGSVGNVAANVLCSLGAVFCERPIGGIEFFARGRDEDAIVFHSVSSL